MKNNNGRKKSTKKLTIALCMVIFAVVFSSTVYAVKLVNEQSKVNELELPELDSMKITKQIKNIEKSIKPQSISKMNYKQIQEQLGVSLLNSELSKDDKYMISDVETDNKDYAIIKCDNYILGDTSNYSYNEEGFYSFDEGNLYKSPISLQADIILSETQLNNVWTTDYLGMYGFVEQFVSEQGYKVNLIETKNDGNQPQNFVSKKIAVFVADGIRYTLTGRTTVDNMKQIVNSMK
ncbi:MAG: hypothetical protein KH152_07125 [Finegoldia magna]|uniref:DUF4367 domain-containing protein n=2 Tax=Finegoldia magna TaxID=1260 RepID=A0A7D4JE47_FINMA|nr:hypothetical protein [Finegoldia magna]EFL54499.1 hypothetical protein HMPREF9289_0300 [Finegoldia magna BVS033A4]EGS31942.1 hypothetical protein HMPREF9489_0726 [Finegoldia magna SY403409CC001050417]MBS6928271.1 hypothetical protein [Finegoldia magna]QKH80399.1 hypothetical protein FOC70_08565 [Finegoldia magna]